MIKMNKETIKFTRDGKLYILGKLMELII